jgi:hypothetical protein
MNRVFKRMIDKLPPLFKELKHDPKKTRHQLRDIPAKGVYVFYKGDRAKYVGRSNRMKARIQGHSQESSNRNAASFAFQLAKEAARRNGLYSNPPTPRRRLERSPRFIPFFLDAKDKVSKMNVRCVSVENQNLQALFEIYASVAYKTKYNDFNTH